MSMTGCRHPRGRAVLLAGYAHVRRGCLLSECNTHMSVHNSAPSAICFVTHREGIEAEVCRPMKNRRGQQPSYRTLHTCAGCDEDAADRARCCGQSAAMLTLDHCSACANVSNVTSRCVSASALHIWKIRCCCFVLTNMTNSSNKPDTASGCSHTWTGWAAKADDGGSSRSQERSIPVTSTCSATEDPSQVIKLYHHRVCRVRHRILRSLRVTTQEGQPRLTREASAPSLPPAGRMPASRRRRRQLGSAAP